MKTLALIGAGGKMGCRITNNVKKSDWQVATAMPMEIDPEPL